MRKALITAFVCLFLCATIVLCSIPAINADTEETATIDGYIMIAGEYKKNTDIIISFYSPENEPIKIIGIDDDGYFSMNVPAGVKSTECQISFSLKGYGVTGLPETISETSVKVDDEIRYYLSDAFPGDIIESGKVYSLCEKGAHSISLNSTYGKLNGRVLCSSIGVNDVKVTLKDGDTAKLSTTTSMGGKFSFDQCPTGEYTLEFSSPGYNSTSETVTIMKGEVTNIEVDIEKNTTVSGLSITQITMIVCGTIAGVLVLIAIIGFAMNRKSGSHFINRKN